jgi:hypothetical protein
MLDVLTDDSSIQRIAVSGWVAVYVKPPLIRNFSEAAMEAILSVALVLGVCGLAVAKGDS